MVFKVCKQVRWYALSAIIAAVIVTFWTTETDFYKNSFSSGRICRNGEEPVSMVLVGDLLIGGGKVHAQLKKDEYNPRPVLGSVYDVLEEGDLVFANFEGIISGQHEARQKNLPPSFSVRSDPAIIDFLKNLKNPILSFANNHSADFGLAGIKDAVALLDEYKIAYVGMGLTRDAATKPAVFDSFNTRVAFVAFTDLLPEEYYADDVRPGIAELTSDSLKKSIDHAKSISDF